MSRALVFIGAAVILLHVAASSAEETPLPSADAFAAWLDEFRTEARGRGVSETTLDRALSGLEPLERVIELDRRQPEFTQTFWSYLDKRVTPERIERGRELLGRHAGLLERVHRRYGVQPRFLVAFWGMESNYGEFTGEMPLVASLATLAFDRRRSRFFREQLIAALQLIDRGHIPVDAAGSWAGAMGQPQFIPTTYREHAADGDGDGRVDLWNSLADVFASASNFLAKSGWQGNRTWGREVSLPDGFDLELTGLDVEKKLAEWQRLGVRRFDGRDLPRVDITASLVLPAGHRGPAFLVYRNFRTTLVWNRSILYAIAVGHLADRLTGGGPLLTPPPADDSPLSREEVIEIQRHLGDAGFYRGDLDGIAGSGTRAAVKAFQRAESLPADGHVDSRLLDRLRRANGKDTQQ